MITDAYLTGLIDKNVEAYIMEGGKSIGIQGILKSFDEGTLYLANPDISDNLLDRSAVKTIAIKDGLEVKFPETMEDFLSRKNRGRPLRSGNNR